MSLELEMKRMFRERDSLVAQLAALDQAIDEKGEILARSKGYRAKLRPETLRQMAEAA